MEQKTDISKMQFIPCKIEIVTFDSQDIITTSGNTFETDNLYGGDWTELPGLEE